jgi:hypothetical protein
MNHLGTFTRTRFSDSMILILHQIHLKGKDTPSIQRHLMVVLQKNRRKRREQTETKLTLIDLPSILGIPKLTAGAEIIYSLVVLSYLSRMHVRAEYKASQ